MKHTCSLHDYLAATVCCLPKLGWLSTAVGFVQTFVRFRENLFNAHSHSAVSVAHPETTRAISDFGSPVPDSKFGRVARKYLARQRGPRSS